MIIKRLTLRLQSVFDWLDGLLDKLTSYRLILYTLYILLAYSLILSIKGDVAFTWYQLVRSVIWLVLVCKTSNIFYSRVFKIPRNTESDLITALILALILTPAATVNDAIALTAAGFAAMAAKYILTIGGRHIFNPAALGAFIAGVIFHNYASWWVGSNHLTPLVIIAGILILRKMKRFQMAGLFLVLFLVYTGVHTGIGSSSMSHQLWFGLTSTAVLFFATIMLTEPLTSPTGHNQTLLYASLVAVLYSVTKLKLSPEESLLAGNILTYAVAPSRRLSLSLVNRVKDADGIYSFVFKSSHRPNFLPGQYMEWTLPDTHSDKRGNRRYLTISSSPTEDELMFTLKIPPKPSSFKGSLGKMTPGNQMLAAQIAGHFTLPKDTSKPVVFIAGGVGITPYRSMIKYLLDKNQPRKMTLIYSANTPEELAFSSLFKQAEKVGLKTIHTITSPDIKNWAGETGPVNAPLVAKWVPDYKSPLFYISGPQAFVAGIRHELTNMGISHKQIITDFFPGYS